MKKALSILLSLLLVMCSMPLFAFAAEKTYDQPLNAYAPYDEAEIRANNSEYINAMSYDMLAGVLLDWLDKQIAKATADFQGFELEVFGQTITIEPDISSLDAILQYAGYLSQLGGDFANLDTTALTGLSRANGDINFIFSIQYSATKKRGVPR